MRIKNNPGTRAARNPLKPNEAAQIKDLLAQKQIKGSDAEIPRIDAVLQAQNVAEQDLDPEAIAALFPRREPGEKGWKTARIPDALEKYDLIARVSKLLADPPRIEGRLLTNEDIAAYIAQEAQLTLVEARDVLQRMKRSSTKVVGVGLYKSGNPKTFDRAMQPSSAITREMQSRKLPHYNPPAGLLYDTNNVIIVISPPEATPRVMTWRRGTHVDADLALKGPGNVLPLIGTALKAAMIWLAEKPGRKNNAKIVVYTVGDNKAQYVWVMGEPLSTQSIHTNWGRSQPLPVMGSKTADQEAASNKDEYFAAMTDTFGTVNLARKRRGRPSKYPQETAIPYSQGVSEYQPEAGEDEDEDISGSRGIGEGFTF